MDDLRPEPISSDTKSPGHAAVASNWIINLIKDNIASEIPELVEYRSIIDIVMTVKAELKSRRLEAAKWLAIYNKQVEDDRHIENQRDELNAEIIELKKEISLLKAKALYDIIKIN